MQFDSSVINMHDLSAPSFNSYNNSNLADIAARVVVEEEFVVKNPDDEFFFDNNNNPEQNEERINDHQQNSKEEQDIEFEFVFVTKGHSEPYFSPIPADEIFRNGQIRPVYPVFGDRSSEEKAPKVRLPLRKLFIEERETSITDELDGIAEETYCVWRPNEEGRCKKSGSEGSNNSKRWKFKDLMMSSEGGKGSFVFSYGSRKKENEETKVEKSSVVDGKVKSEDTVKESSVVNGKVKSVAPRKNDEKRRSYLPYKKDLVGLFSNVNGFNLVAPAPSREAVVINQK